MALASRKYAHLSFRFDHWERLWRWACEKQPHSAAADPYPATKFSGSRRRSASRQSSRIPLPPCWSTSAKRLASTQPQATKCLPCCLNAHRQVQLLTTRRAHVCLLWQESTFSGYGMLVQRSDMWGKSLVHVRRRMMGTSACLEAVLCAATQQACFCASSGVSCIIVAWRRYALGY